MSRKIVDRTEMPKQSPEARRTNFSEVALGLDPELARREAERCIQCKTRPCTTGCPVEVDIPEFVALIAEGKYDEAAAKIKEKNSLPAICGRVCPQESQCESLCTLGKKFEPVAIGALERFAADWASNRAAEVGRACAKPALVQVTPTCQLSANAHRRHVTWTPADVRLTATPDFRELELAS